ncbi:2-phospho-L-lactate guanylyltransferase [Streptomonospora nanhaiensis]|uniref:2-phospho-L-lactate guanylyltransferase n=1 Tax=Streptomonospora nanhaiensis TaxID=1323731 RepID=UPI001C99BDD0|nr:2-phospho-L-lactate guanylyltransferase [Streptomonospora nanhaiensis]MBX9391388.1 2-phospho-L-lactate guanylyltransferase [Streptomonospora nanhaiensis]
MPPLDDDRRWSLVVPVKRLGAAKSRLAGAAELRGLARADLALAVACDTVMAAVSCPRVGAVFVVTDDDRAARALAELGARVVGGEPGTGLNPALVHGAALALREFPHRGRAALSADLPALRAGELERVLDAAAAHPVSFLPDAPGIGTTLYAARPGAAFAPAFEGASRRRHRAAGAVELDGTAAPSVRRDVDTPEDLREAAALGVGPHTAKLLARAAR